MKYALLSLFLAAPLASCLMNSEPKIVHRDYSVGPECLREDSTTWTDTTETRHMSCVVGDSTEPRPPAHP